MISDAAGQRRGGQEGRTKPEASDLTIRCVGAWWGETRRKYKAPQIGSNGQTVEQSAELKRSGVETRRDKHGGKARHWQRGRQVSGYRTSCTSLRDLSLAIRRRVEQANAASNRSSFTDKKDRMRRSNSSVRLRRGQ